MKKILKRIIFAVLISSVLFLGFVFYFASIPVTEPNVGNLKHDLQIFSKNFIMSNYSRFKNLTEADYAPNILDENYEWEDLTAPYFDSIRNDVRLKKFYGKESYNLHDYLQMREYLRDLFPHGDTSKSYLNENLLVMIDEAEKGEEFICGDISKMLCEMIMASGTYARTIRISEEIGLGHVVVEYWSKEYNKWILLDPDYNVYYTTLDSIPLNGIELYQLANKNGKILRIKGKSENTLFDSHSKIFEHYYKYGVAIDFYDKWVSKNYGRSNPITSPINSCVYIGHNKIRQRYFKDDYSLNDKDIIKLVYSNPFEYMKSKK